MFMSTVIGVMILLMLFFVAAPCAQLLFGILDPFALPTGIWAGSL